MCRGKEHRVRECLPHVSATAIAHLSSNSEGKCNTNIERIGRLGLAQGQEVQIWRIGSGQNRHDVGQQVGLSVGEVVLAKETIYKLSGSEEIRVLGTRRSRPVAHS